MAKILIVAPCAREHDRLFDGISRLHGITILKKPKDAYSRVVKEAFDLILFDMSNKMLGIRFIKGMQQSSPMTPIIVSGGEEKAEIIVKVIKAGAFDFVVKPFTRERINLSINHALESYRLKKEIDYLRRQQDINYDLNQIVAISPIMKKVMSQIKKFASTDSTVLMTGESGTGKSFLAGAIHFNGQRKRRPFIQVNCANLPNTLLESELFGHEKGAFTGATKTRLGRFEQADGGTIFLDEIGDMSPSVQVKLLRVLDEKTFERLGGDRTIHSEARIIAATNRNIEHQVAAGQFREDLYYRIDVLRVHLPPLRDRRACIEPLAHHLLQKLSRTVNSKFEGFSPGVIEKFENYSWPGNIRQLSNVIERALLLEEGPVLTEDSLKMEKVELPEEFKERGGGIRLSSEQERRMILEALERSQWVQKDAAHLLGISRRSLNYRIKKFGITHHKWRKHRTESKSS